MIYGSPDQQQRYRQNSYVAKSYTVCGTASSTGVGSASLRTRAERDGDGWIINGEDLTTTYWATAGGLRSAPIPQPNQSTQVSVFVVRTTRRASRRPIRTMYDGEFGNTFDNVQVGADALVGEVNGRKR